MPCESKPELGENDPSRRFPNLKASFYQTLADAFEHDQIEGLTDETTIGQLAGILTEFDSRGRIRIESKEDARKRGVCGEFQFMRQLGSESRGNLAARSKAMPRSCVWRIADSGGVHC